jgi:serine/threonine-protein kinase
MGRYTLYGKVATGGMATLYLGRLVGPSGFARTVAVKCLHPQFAQDPDFSAMFLDEARLASRIRSPYVVPTLDVVSEDGELAIVMEYVHGESLGALVRSLSDTDAGAGHAPQAVHDGARSEVPVAVAVSVLDDVLQGLQAAHEARSEQGTPLGIVHRDVSPQNILVGTDGLAHLIDFGVAKAAGRVQTTREGQLKGKLAYMAPEQLRGEPVTCRSDLYAASVVLWEALVGRRLFSADDEGATVTRVLMGDVKPPSKAVREGRSPGDIGAIERLDTVVMRGLDRDPAKRFETARDMAAALVRCLAPASAADVTRWLEQAAGPALARRASAIAAIEGDPTGSSMSPRPEDVDVGVAAEPPKEEASSISVASGITTAAGFGRRRRASLWVAAGVLVAVAAVVARIPWRGSSIPRSSAATALPAAASRDPGPIESSLAAAPELGTPSTSPPATAASPSTVSPPQKKAPPALRPSDCNPPYTWDDQGKKHYKRHCL